MKEKIKIYTAAEIKRYHDGKMPGDEMNALEKAALEDPFLADALEGYLHAPAVEEDIAELQHRLAGRKKKTRIFSLSSFARQGWWRVAALFIVIFGTIYFFYAINNTKTENSLASKALKGTGENQARASALEKDTVTTTGITSEKDLAAAFEQREKSKLPGPSPQIKNEPLVTVQKGQPEEASALLSRSKQKVDAGSTYIEREEQQDVQPQEYLLNGKVTDQEGNAVPFATITDDAGAKETVTDTAGRFLLRSHDSSISVTASAAGYTSKSFMLTRDREPVFEISKKDTELNDAVVSRAEKGKRFNNSVSKSKALSGDVSGMQEIKRENQPTGVGETFDQYLKQNIRRVYDQHGERLTGEVRLSFSIDRKGKPENIVVVKSSCVSCENEAVRLLENGPPWTGKKNSLKEVVIKF